MCCDDCGSDDSLFVVVHGNSREETRLCRVCALKKGYLSDEGLAALPQLDSILDQLEKPVDHGSGCPACGMELDQLVEAGRLGCPGCVQAFKRQFLLARKRRGLAAGYTGRIPKSLAFEVAGLETDLMTDLGPHTGAYLGSSSLSGSEPGRIRSTAEESAPAVLPAADVRRGSRLLADMQSAVLAEDFEKAALIRDCLGSISIDGKAGNDT